MRNPERIPEILELIRQIWVRYPDLRLGQLILNACNDDRMYHMEDDNLVAELKRIYLLETYPK